MSTCGIFLFVVFSVDFLSNVTLVYLTYHVVFMGNQVSFEGRQKSVFNGDLPEDDGFYQFSNYRRTQMFSSEFIRRLIQQVKIQQEKKERVVSKQQRYSLSLPIFFFWGLVENYSGKFIQESRQLIVFVSKLSENVRNTIVSPVVVIFFWFQCIY